jgi:hypothetical protein
MSDYLGNLAARALKPAGVRPRLRSLFEPATISSSMALPEVEQHIEVREVVPAARPTSAPVTPPPSLHASAPPPDLPRALTAQTAPTHSWVPVLAPVSVPAPPPAARRTETPALPVITESRALRPQRLDTPPPPPAVPITQRVERLEKQTTLIQSHSHESVRLVETRGPSIAADRTPPLRVTPALPPHESRAVSPVTHTALIDGPVERPDIHVSIGCVIVNSPAPSPAPKPAPPTPAPLRLTLDQYLRQRGGRS